MDADQPRLSSQTLRVLGALMSCPGDELSGAQIGRTTKLATGTLYPILSRLERAGWVESRWEDGDPHILGRPRRRFYLITALGAKNATAAVNELQAAFSGRLVWS
jgi:PadR family transcriptional regulator, regulatory protein PadR